MRLASEIVALYHGHEHADAAKDYFISTFSKKEQPVEAESATIPAEVVDNGRVRIADLIAALGMAKSKGNAKDLIKAGAVSIEGEKVAEGAEFDDAALRGKVLRVGKHQFRKLD
jgi:tyrosyl-tRNA synthetase